MTSLFAKFGPNSPFLGTDEPMLRAELFSVSQLEQHARTLAAWHQVGPTHRGADDQLLPRLDENERALEEALHLVTEAVQRGRRITPAAEWFIDNYHLIEEQIRTAKRHLPRGYSRELPRLTSTRAAGVPRIYDLVLELVSHSHGRLDMDALRAFINAYQVVQPLRLGELWAIPIMLRLALIENLRRVVASVVAGRRDRELASIWVEKMIDRADTAPAEVVLILADMVKANPPLTNAFVAELASRLQGMGPALVFPMSWLEQRLGERGQSVEYVFQQVTRSQAADQVAIGNSIGSLRLLSATDWRDFVEAMSVVERQLVKDPAGVYSKMDFATRDRYRHVVEAMARRSPLSEADCAAAAIKLAGAESDPRQRHVGYFLIDRGLDQLEGAAQLRRSPRMHARRLARRARLSIYTGSIIALSALLTAALTWILCARGVEGPWLTAAMLLGLVTSSQLAMAVVQWAATLLAHPAILPRLDFSGGIPAAHHTAVAVPTMLTDPAEIERLLSALEVRYLANRDRQLSFVLLTDFRDASTEHVDNDDALLQAARDGIAELNERHGAAFFLFHRPRLWNARQGVWMGWERKRGKLEQFNEALRGKLAPFSSIAGEAAKLADVKYVIVLDSDTDLPRDSARELAGTLAHPLNRPRFDAKLGRVVEGYAILQPRVAITMDSARRSRFAGLFAGEPGIDPYTRAVSDVYQDVFDEGSFVGKGIYDVDAIQQAIGGKLPTDRVLSHDLLEGAYARAGLVSDVLLFEDFPSAYSVEVSRRHRWTRGDWQIMSWLRRSVPGSEGRVKNPISLLSQWKILDNLRRSIIPVALVGLLAVGWACGAGALTTLAVLGIMIVPGLLAAAGALARRPTEQPRASHSREIGRGFVLHIAREGFALACLPYDALVSLGAIFRTWGRLFFTGKRLLEWRTAADAQRSSRTSLPGAFRSMLITPVVAVGAAIALYFERRDSLPVAAPVLALWTVAPALMWWLSSPTPLPRSELVADDVVFLRKVARRTWRFFDTYVAAGDNHLPPDNFQEDPPQGIAHRTSPTNIGLALTANLAAFDFGYLTPAQVLERTKLTLATLEKLQRYRGHFYNWYDTVTLEPLRPTYISTVDSGNLSGYLLTLASGLRELVDTPILSSKIWDGLGDVLAIIEELSGPTHPLRAILAEPAPTSTRGVRERLAKLQAVLPDPPAEPELAYWTEMFARQLQAAQVEIEAWPDADSLQTLAQLRTPAAAARITALRELAARATEMADLDFDFLYDKNRHLLAIGYNVVDHRLDASFYDLLASEARLASFIAIAHDKLPQEHWFSLGRQLTTTAGRPALLSWSGSMFEYLMPLLIMPTYRGTILDETYRGVVDRQIEYGKERGVPWGVSESGYNKTDAHLNYQYRAFGVPGLGFKRGLAEDLVVAPYASAMALMVDPRAATDNLRRLAKEGELGHLGFYEAIDYTAGRLPRGKEKVTVASYMAHHQGMAFLSLAYTLLDQPMQRRFEADPAFRATDLLLQERVPRVVSIHPRPADIASPLETTTVEPNLRIFTSPGGPAPQVQLLSNGSYHVMVSNAGGGYSRWRDLAVTRWQEDATRDSWGSFCYLRDVTSGRFWSVAHQPAQVRTPTYEAIFSQGRAEFRRRDGELDTHVEIGVSPEDDIELRRITLTNLRHTKRTIEITTFAEVVLTTAGTDVAHPAFSNLFVQTELIKERQAILCTRRPRSGSEKPPFLLHLMSIQGQTTGSASYETGRAEFLGRGRSATDPQAMYQDRLGDSQGSVLDPVIAIRHTVVIPPDETVVINVVTGVSETREGALALIEKYADRHSAERVFDLSTPHSQVLLRRLDATEADAQTYERLASYVLYSNQALRAPRTVLARNSRGQSALWAYAISGDLPILLLRIADREHLQLVRQMVQAHAYFRLKGLATDLIIWNEDPSGYRQVLQEEIMGTIAALGEGDLLDKPGGIFVRRSDQIAEEDKVLFQTVARLILVDSDGSLLDQLNRRQPAELKLAPFVIKEKRPPVAKAANSTSPISSASASSSPLSSSPIAIAPGGPVHLERNDLTAWNGKGGFTSDGREYVITTTRDAPTPAPWVNVLANPYFGTVVSESGGAYTWCENARNYRLTPWANDPVSDPSGEAFYIRDEADGRFWSPTPLPAGGRAPYTTRHGFGYSVFEYVEDGIVSELRTFVATDAPLKFQLFKLTNHSGRRRRLSLTGLFELVLGEQRPQNVPYIVTEIDPASGALLAKNAYASEFARRVTFLDCSEDTRFHSGDRQELIGRNGTLARPAWVNNANLSGRVGAGLDPCLAMQVMLDLDDGEEREIAFTFGSGMDLTDARTLVQRFHGVGPARTALEGVWSYWNRTLGAVHVQTPDPAVNFMANGWLLYQTLAARMWGRSGFYQSGGAFGYRDQLQDSMSLVHAEPALLREQIVRSASRQFKEGDVQHWWHPPMGRGVRTRISDDYLWLPHAVCRYVTALGDTGVLDERAPYLEGRAVKPDEESYYDLPLRSEESGTVYEHCVRAIEHGLRFGVHGLPLMGTGDWNDGMNLVGDHGKGESVWLAFFLNDVLTRFGELARARKDIAFADRCAAAGKTLRDNIEKNAWDGAWYRRAYFDNGEPLGSKSNVDCRIDSLPQSWSVIAPAGDPARAKQALASLDTHLVHRDLKLIQLFDPPFDKSEQKPGYIKGYVPGVRENGGQYTHAAVWAVMAFAAAGDIARAWELFALINPVRHGDSEEAIAKYKVEPYVIAADVYTNPQHAGRGGWTWYTGSAGWMYRLVIESLLGIHLEVNHLRLAPLLPAGWNAFDVHYRYRSTMYHIHVQGPAGGGKTVARVVCDGAEQQARTIPLRDDGAEHHADVFIS